jgi:hypothetical protein
VSHRKDAKSGKVSRSVRIPRDAQFMRDLLALLEYSDDAGWPRTSVNRTLASSMFPTLSPLTRRSKRKAWWELPWPSPRVYRIPSEVRSWSLYLEAEYLLLALRALGPVHTFTLNLRRDVESLACEKPNTADFLRRRIERQLSALLGRQVEFFFTLEEEPPRRVHLHGAIGVSVEEVEAARLALRKAGGEWKRNRQRQTKTEVDPDSTWNSYITKDCWRTTPFVRALALRSPNPRPMTKFNGPPLFATRIAARKDRELYEDHRRIVLSAIRARHPAIIAGRKRWNDALAASLEPPTVTA